MRAPEVKTRTPRRKPRSTGGGGPRTEAAAGKGYGLAKAKKFKKTAPFRGAVRAAYDTNPTPVRSQLARAQAKGRSAPARAVTHTHKTRVAGLRKRKTFEGTFTGLSQYGRERAERFRATPAMSRALAAAREASGRDEQIREAERLRQLAIARKLGTQGRFDPRKVREKAQAKTAKESLRAGIAPTEILQALNKVEKKNESAGSKVLRQLTRVNSGVVGSVEAAAKGKSLFEIGKAGVKGVVSNDKSFVKTLGGKNPSTLARVAGTVADIATDPTTYLMLGATAPAKAAARGASVAALRAGEGEAAALKVARATYDASKLKSAGVQVGFRGTPVRLLSVGKQLAKGKGLREAYRASTRQVSTKGKLTSRATGVVAPGVRATGRLLAHGSERAERASRASSRAAGQMLPVKRPREVHPVDYDFIRDAAREYRAARGHGERVSGKRARAYRKFAKVHGVDAAGVERIVHAVERDSGRGLAQNERRLYGVIRRDLNDITRAEIDSGIRAPHELVQERRRATLEKLAKQEGGHGSAHDVLRFLDEVENADQLPKGYYPRTPRGLDDLLADIEAKLVGPRRGSQGERISATSLNERKVLPAIEHLPEEEAARYVTDDVAVPMAHRIGDHYRALATSDFHRKLAALGTRLTKGDVAKDVPAAIRAARGTWETVLVRDGRGFRPIGHAGDSSLDRARKVRTAVLQGEDVRVLPEKTYNLAWQHAQRGRSSLEASTVGGRAYDRLQGNLKTGLTVVNPGYHVTNLIGDTFNARLGGARVVDMARASKQVLTRERKLENLDADLLHSLHSSPPMGEGKVRDYGANGKLSDADVVDMARKHGAIQMGFAGNELRALRETGQAPGKGGRVMENIRRWNEYREDIMRLASFQSALKRGMEPREAAAHVNRYHFDYGDLSEFERSTMRRLIPFYTFGSRNAVLQARGVLGSPGRYASVEKVRDQAADAAGLPRDFVERLPGYVQRQIPFASPITFPSILGGDGTPVAINFKLPMNDLNLINPTQWPDEFQQRLTPLFKLPVEVYTGFDFFTGKEAKKLVPAPTWAMNPQVKEIIESVDAIPGVGKPKVTMGYDRRSGKMVPYWPRWTDKLVRLLPAGGAASSAFTPGKTRHAKGAMGTSSYLLGPRPFPIDPAEARVGRLFERLDELDNELEELKITVPHRAGTPWGGRIKKLNEERSKVMGEISEADAQAGSLNPYFTKPKKKGRAPKRKAGAFGTGRSGSKPFGASG